MRRLEIKAMKRRPAIGPTLLFSLLLVAGGWYVARAQSRLVLESGSQLWIEGASTVNTFTCHTEDVGGYGVLERGAAQGLHPSAVSGAPAARAEITVYVDTFDCGKKRMNRDFEIDPPAALVGLIRAHDRIRVRFDLVAASSTTTTTPSMQ